MSQITYLAELATQLQNTPGVLTPILEFDPEDGTMQQLKNMVAKGDEEGVPIFFDLRDADGNPLPDDTEVLLRVKRPTDEEPMTVSQRERNIAPWNSLPVAEQRNEENIDSVKVSLKGAVISVRHMDTFRVEILSTEQVDWSNSELYVYRKAQRTVDYEG